RKVKPEHFETIISRQEQRLLQSHIRSFSSDGMIPYLLLTGRPKASAEDLYKALESSASLLDFLHRAGFAENYMQEFLETFEVKGQGKRDYGRLMDRYFGSGRVDGEGAEPDAGSCGPASA
ncbi:MAG: hypothetical protein QGH74_02200, partial [Candidatus Brocadiia bacterium]|nr:hypothetical protein [Candidatus Brocadiia bacterium]